MDDAHSLPDEAARPHRRGCIKTWRSLCTVLSADLYRYAGCGGLKAFARHYLFTPGYHYTVLMRLCGYLKL